VALGAVTSSGSGDHSGSSAGNLVVSASTDYALAAQPTITSVAGTITAAPLTAAATITAAPKVYDGRVVATGSTVGGSLSGAVGTDAVLLDTSALTLAYSDAHVVGAKTIGKTGNVALGAVTSSGSGDHSGSSAGNLVVSASTDYALAAQPTITSVAGTITAAPLTAAATITAAPKVYDGRVVATGSTVGGSLSGAVGTDAVLLDTSALTLAYSDAHVVGRQDDRQDGQRGAGRGDEFGQR